MQQAWMNACRFLLFFFFFFFFFFTTVEHQTDATSHHCPFPNQRKFVCFLSGWGQAPRGLVRGGLSSASKHTQRGKGSRRDRHNNRQDNLSDKRRGVRSAFSDTSGAACMAGEVCVKGELKEFVLNVSSYNADKLSSKSQISTSLDKAYLGLLNDLSESSLLTSSSFLKRLFVFKGYYYRKKMLNILMPEANC